MKRGQSRRPLVVAGAVVALGVAGGAVASAAGINLTASHLVSAPNVPPAFWPTSVATADGAGHPGRVEKVDSLTVTVSARIAATTLCSGATGATNQTWAVTAQIARGVGNDVLTIPTGPASCPTPRFGSVDLGAAGFVPSTLTFSGSTLVLTQGTATATITLLLGTPNGVGNLVSVASVTTWRPDSALTNSSGTGVGTNTAVSTAAVQF